VLVQVDHIDDRGHAVAAGLGDVWAVAAVSQAADAIPSTLVVEVHLRHAHGRVFVDGAVMFSAMGACERCAEQVLLTLDVPVSLTYAPANANDVGSGDVELHRDELDVGWFEHGQLDLAQVLSEAVALAMPSRLLCEDQGACEARTSALLGSTRAPTAFSALADLKNLMPS